MSAAETLATLVSSTPAAERPALAAELARALASVFAMTSATSTGNVPGTRPGQSEDAPSLLTVDEAAQRLGVATTWLYRHAKKLPFTRKLGHRTLRFDARALDRWAASRR